jgi:hypothetical protein
MRPTVKSIHALTLVLTASLAAGCSSGTAGDAPTAANQASGTSAAAIGGTAAPALISFSCDVNAGGPAYSYLTATGQLTAGGVPTNVAVFPTYTPTNVGSYRKTGQVVPNYPTTPSFPRYQAWNVTGHANNVGTDGDLYYLVLPRVLPGRGGVVPGEVHVEFSGGANGGWQAIGLCLIG